MCSVERLVCFIQLREYVLDYTFFVKFFVQGHVLHALVRIHMICYEIRPQCVQDVLPTGSKSIGKQINVKFKQKYNITRNKLGDFKKKCIAKNKEKKFFWKGYRQRKLKGIKYQS